MEWFQALILGIIQGLTEYLPVSSSGHLAIGQHLFGLDSGESNLAFTITVHVATVLSTCVILWREIVWLFTDTFKDLFRSEGRKGADRWSDGSRYVLNIIISMIPIGIVGVFFKDNVEEFFGNELVIVGVWLFITAALRAFAHFAKPRQRENISPLHAFIIGIAQAVAVLPGLSRSGSTIATGLLLGNKKEKLAQFSFLMVIPPILGEALLDTKEMIEVGVEQAMGGLSSLPLIIGFLAAFLSAPFR